MNSTFNNNWMLGYIEGNKSVWSIVVVERHIWYLSFYYSIELADYSLSHGGGVTIFDIYVFITALSWLTITLVMGGSLHMIYIYVFITALSWLTITLVMGGSLRMIYVFITALSWLTITLAMGGSLHMIYMFLVQHWVGWL